MSLGPARPQREGSFVNQSSKKRYDTLKKFDAAHAPAGMLRRYAKARSGTIWMRVCVVAAACLLLAIAASPATSLLVALVAVPLDFVEYLVLRKWLKRDVFDQKIVNRSIVIASFVQSIGIGCGLFITGIYSNEMRLLAWTVLMGAVINSMLLAPYHRASHHLRIVGLSGFAAAVLVYSWSIGQISLMMMLSEGAMLIAVGGMLWGLFTHLSHREQRMRNAERALMSRSEYAERLALVAKHASDSIILMDAALKIKWVNPQFTNVTGYAPEDAIARTPAELLNHPDTSPQAIQKLVDAGRNKRPVRLRILNRTKDNRAIWVETHQTPVIDADGNVEAFIAVERDVSDVVARENQLRVALLAAEDADREKTAFLSRMSHELRTPANGILGGIELLQETAFDEKQSEALDIIESSAHRLMNLVDNIVTIAGTQSNSIETHFEDIDVSEIVGSVLSKYQMIVGEKGIDLIAEVAESAQITMRTDPSFVHGILDRLISNAVKFTPDGTVTLKAWLEQDNWLHIAVEDTGVGIPDEKVSEIFKPFEQVDEADTRNFDGAGLGLATAKNLATLLGGRIVFRQGADKGSRFKLKIPVFVDQDRPHRAGKMGLISGKSGAPFRKVLKSSKDLGGKEVEVDQVDGNAPDVVDASSQMRLLVAEDNRTNRLLIKSMLKNAGHAVEFAQDGVEAVERYVENRPDFVLMDLSMPNKNGFDATREIRALEAKDSLRRCPIVAVTANVTEDDRRKCFDAGMDAFLPKPLKKALLLETIGTVSA